MSQPKSQPWKFLTKDPQKILEGLREGEFDHIYPASPTVFDRFLSYLGHIGVRAALDEFPDSRERRSIPVRLLAQVLLVRPLFAVSSLAQLGPALSASPEILALLGFNAHQVERGFRANANRRPFDEETLANFASGISAQDCLQHCLAVVKLVIAAQPHYFAGATIIVDSKGVYAPPGKGGLPAVELKVCTLSLLVEREAVPLVWLFAPDREAEVTLGKALLGQALPLLLAAGVEELLLDAGYLDGAWLAGLHREGLRVCIKVKQDMLLYQDALGATRVRDVLRPRQQPPWQEAPPPKIKGRPRPRRQAMLVRDLESWESLGQATDALVIRDTYPEGQIQETVIACLGNTESDPLAVLARWRGRWAIEEFFMVADRYRKLGRLFPCREGFARAWVHFAFLAHMLLWFFDHFEPEEPIPPPKSGGLLVIRGPWYAIISFGRLVQIMLDHHSAWQAKRTQVLARLGITDSFP